MSDETNKFEDPQRSALNILNNANLIKIKDKFVFKLSKNAQDNIKEFKNYCKVLQFSSEFSFEEVLATLDVLEPEDYPNLFIFVISTTSFSSIKDKIEEFKSILLKFGISRPLIIQLTFTDDNVPTFYYKEELSSDLITPNPLLPKTSSKITNLPKFLNFFLNGFDENAFNDLDVTANRLIILRFLRALNLSPEFFKNLILNIAAKGTIDEFLATLDAPFDYDGQILLKRAEPYICRVFKDSSDPNINDSVLLRAVNSSNMDIIDIIFNELTDLIQELPFDHQVKISGAAFETNQLNVLCGLLNIADFPFPDNFLPRPINHEELERIVAERVEFEAAIKAEDINTITKFTNKNLDIKIAYNINNNSALMVAGQLGLFNIYNYLEQRGFQSKNPKEEDFSKEVRNFVAHQRKKNVNEGLLDDQMAVNSLCNKSVIYNKRITKEQENEYRRKIRSWLENISKIKNGQEFLAVAASCPRLKIIFDFENRTVENASLAGKDAEGSMYSYSKLIFVGAKLENKDGNITKQRDQKIKGVLAHELCHYVMKLVYENLENPFFKHRKDMKEIFYGIIQAINKWPSKYSKVPDDECNGIISSVFKLYNPKDFSPELIVRVVQILTEYAENEKLKDLEQKYKNLFEFWFKNVVPDLQKYLQRDKEVVKINGLFGVLPCITKLKYELSNDRNTEMENITSSKVVIVQSNVPKLLFVNILKHLNEQCENLLDSQNIFVNPESFKNQQLFDYFKETFNNSQVLRIIVDCSTEVHNNFGKILSNTNLNIIFVVKDNDQAENLVEYCNRNGLKVDLKLTVNYYWNDLTEKCKSLMLQTKICFQNNSQITLKDLLKVTDEESSSSDLTKIVDGFLLNLLLENKQVFINVVKKEVQTEKLFKFLYQERSFIEKQQISNEQDVSTMSRMYGQILNTFGRSYSLKTFKMEEILKKISKDDLFSNVKGNQFVLVSDTAGNGKSWTMKYITSELCRQNPTSWANYVDLKLFIDKFKTNSVKLEFSTFMIENILKLEHQFEATIFQKLYNEGKVFIIFDGFDEIAPNYADFVAQLAQNFQHNGGNQLWIATRDFFEVDLKNKLTIDKAYCLDKMTTNDGIDLITRYWVLKDLEVNKNEPKSKEELAISATMSPKFESYQQKARQIIEKAFITRNNSLGLPLLFKMIAESLKDEVDVNDLRGSKIYDKFMKIMYKRWCKEKGRIREEASTESISFRQNFWVFHQYHALLSQFPKLAKLIAPNYNNEEWGNEEIIACGIVTIKDEKIVFIHETYREFFVAYAIARLIAEKKIKASFFFDVLTLYKFKIVRMFVFNILNDKYANDFKPQIKKLMLQHDEMFSNNMFIEFFSGNNETLASIAFEILKNMWHWRAKWFVSRNIYAVIENVQSQKLFFKFQEFLFDFYETKDLKNLILKHKIFRILIRSNFDIEVIKNFANKIETKTDLNFIRLTIESKNNFWTKFRGNIFYDLSCSSSLSTYNVQEVLKLLEIYFTFNEIFELMKSIDLFGRNILNICVLENNVKNFKILLAEIENYFLTKDAFELFKNLLMQCDIFNANIIHMAFMTNNIKIHKTLWEILLRSFQDREELKKFILSEDIKTHFIIHEFMIINKTLAVTQLTVKILKENFNYFELKDIFLSNSWFKFVFYQPGACFFKPLEWHDFRRIDEILSKETSENKINLEQWFNILNDIQEGIDQMIIRFSMLNNLILKKPSDIFSTEFIQIALHLLTKPYPLNRKFEIITQNSCYELDLYS